jgi:hypothetical protein
MGRFWLALIGNDPHPSSPPSSPSHDSGVGGGARIKVTGNYPSFYPLASYGDQRVFSFCPQDPQDGGGKG